MMILVGGIGHLYQGDFDLGRRAAARLEQEDLGPDVAVEDFSYGAVAVAQRLGELQPDALVLIAAAERGRAPGTVERRALGAFERTAEEIQAAVADAISGYISLDLVLDVAHGLGALPARTIAIEVEPASTEPSDALSREADAALEEALQLVRAELAAFRSTSTG